MIMHDHHCRQCGTVLDTECPCPEPDHPDFCEICLVITEDDLILDGEGGGDWKL